MSEWLFWLAAGYVAATLLWFTFCVLMWTDHRGHPNVAHAQEAAWWATRAPLWPWYATKGLHRAVGALALDAMKGRPRHGA